MFSLMLVALLQTPAAGAGCTSEPNSTVYRAVRATVDGIIDADNRGALDEVIRFYAADATQWPPEGPPVRGAAAIRPRYAALFADYTLRITSEIRRLCADERLAIVEGSNTVEKRRKTSGARSTTRDTFTMILEKRDGSWKITQLVWSPISQAARSSPPQTLVISSASPRASPTSVSWTSPDSRFVEVPAFRVDLGLRQARHGDGHVVPAWTWNA